MKTDRRRFLKMLAAGGAVVAGEMWIPGERKIFLPPKPSEVTGHRMCLVTGGRGGGKSEFMRLVMESLNRNKAEMMSNIIQSNALIGARNPGPGRVIEGAVEAGDFKYSVRHFTVNLK